MITKFSGDSLFFISDTHFFHQNILRLCERPFDTIEEHDQKLIENWNSVVGPEDTVFHLGDFCFGGAQKWKEIRDQLNGHIILILGNHDIKTASQGMLTMFDYASQQMRIQVDGRTVYLNHFPFLTFAHWNPDVYQRDSLAFALSGHTHIRKGDTGYDAQFTSLYKSTQYDVGVDLNDYKPIAWKEVNRRIQYQIDHHCNLTNWI